MAKNMSISATTTKYTTLKNPTRCLYWKNAVAVRRGTLQERFELVETYRKEDQSWQYLLQCRECDQLYFMDFREETDWANGNDPQFTVYIPVSSTEEGSEVQQGGSGHYVPRLHIDFPSVAEYPVVYWVA